MRAQDLWTSIQAARLRWLQQVKKVDFSGLGVFCCHHGVFPCCLLVLFVAWCFTLPAPFQGRFFSRIVHQNASILSLTSGSASRHSTGIIAKVSLTQTSLRARVPQASVSVSCRLLKDVVSLMVAPKAKETLLAAQHPHCSQRLRLRRPLLGLVAFAVCTYACLDACDGLWQQNTYPSQTTRTVSHQA